MKNFKTEAISKNLKCILTLDQLRILLSKFGVRATTEEVYATLYNKPTDEENGIEDFAVNKLWYKLYGNMYGLNRTNKNYITTYLDRIRTAMPKEVDDRQMIKYLLQYLDGLYIVRVPKVNRVFSNFNAIEFLEQFGYVWKYKKLIASLKANKLTAETNDFKYVMFLRKSFDFAREAGVRKITVVWIAAVILEYMKEKNLTCFKFIKYTEFSDFEQYCRDNNMIDMYEALLQQKEAEV